MKLPDLQEIEAAARMVYEVMPATPQYAWPLLAEQTGAEVWLKHENHTPVGAFKIRGGLVYLEHLKRQSRCLGVISATRGNHGQSIGMAARRHGIPATIVVPHGNSPEKNAAMRALGVELIEHGSDFQDALEFAEETARRESLHFVPSFDPLLVTGVATCGLEFLRAVPDLATVYVPIGLGSGICGMLAARNALGLRCRIVGVVSAQARAYAASYIAKQPVSSPVTTRIADGMACRVVHPEALKVILHQLDGIVEVTDDEVEDAIRVIFECTHNVAEGAGAAAVAAIIKERCINQGQKAGAVITGGNIDRNILARILR
jgi:threonine dehydratase